MKKVTLDDLGYKLIKKDGKYYYNGNLDLRVTNITSLPDNLIVGGYLDIRSTKITSLPDNLVVGERIYHKNTKITGEGVNKVNHNIPKVLFWKNKEYVRVIKGLFYKVLSNKGSIYEVSRIGEDKIYYIITNSNCSKYIVDDSLEDAKKNYNLLNIKNK